MSQLNNIKKAEIILSVATSIQLVIQIIDYEYYYMNVQGVTKRDSEYPYLSNVLRSIISAACAIQVITVIYIYQKTFEMSIEMSSKTKKNIC